MSIPHSAFRIPHSLLMCRPTYYSIQYEINPWMSLKRQVNHARAVAQWTRLHRLLARELGARITLLPARPGVRDLVFTANAGLMHGRTLIRSNFRYPERRREEPLIERFFRRAGCRVVTLDRRYDFEGEGDALWMGEALVLGSAVAGAAIVYPLMGQELLPKFREYDFLMHWLERPGTSLEDRKSVV